MIDWMMAAIFKEKLADRAAIRSLRNTLFDYCLFFSESLLHRGRGHHGVLSPAKLVYFPNMVM